MDDIFNINASFDGVILKIKDHGHFNDFKTSYSSQCLTNIANETSL